MTTSGVGLPPEEPAAWQGHARAAGAVGARPHVRVLVEARVRGQLELGVGQRLALAVDEHDVHRQRIEREVEHAPLAGGQRKLEPQDGGAQLVVLGREAHGPRLDDAEVEGAARVRRAHERAAPIIVPHRLGDEAELELDARHPASTAHEPAGERRRARGRLRPEVDLEAQLFARAELDGPPGQTTLEDALVEVEVLPRRPLTSSDERVAVQEALAELVAIDAGRQLADRAAAFIVRDGVPRQVARAAQRVVLRLEREQMARAG
jgi:hypothetical protein